MTLNVQKIFLQMLFKIILMIKQADLSLAEKHAEWNISKAPWRDKLRHVMALAYLGNEQPFKYCLR